MKRSFKFFGFWLLIALGVATAIFNSCGKDDDGKNTNGKKPAIQIANEKDLTQTVYADETTGTSSVTFTTTGAWSATIPSDASSWLSISQTSGDKAGEYDITLILITNTTGVDRTGIIIILCEGKEITITITQKGLTEDGNVPGTSNTVAVTGISLDKPSLSLSIGDEYTLTATVTPDNATNPTVTWTSNATAVATVSANGVVKAISKGTATITAKAGNQTATCVVTVPDNAAISDDINGVVINGVRWATRNVAAAGTFAAKPEDPGMLYQWNRKKAWSATGTVTGWNRTSATGTTWAKANDPSPSGWRVPAKEEQDKLFETANVTNEWVTLNGVNGRKFTDKTTGASLFLPAAGYRGGDDSILYSAGTNGNYWSSTSSGSSYAYCLYFSSSNALVFADIFGRWTGYSVRAVAE